jgi:hypothetical protein
MSHCREHKSMYQLLFNNWLCGLDKRLQFYIPRLWRFCSIWYLFQSVRSELSLISLCCFWLRNCFCNWGALLPPKKLCSHFQSGSDVSKGKCAILLALHGAGVDAASPLWVGAFNQQDFAWVYSSICFYFSFSVSQSLSKSITILLWSNQKDSLKTLFCGGSLSNRTETLGLWLAWYYSHWLRNTIFDFWTKLRNEKMIVNMF